MSKKDFQTTLDAEVKAVPKRIAFIKRDVSAHVKSEDSEMVMTFPHLVVRGIICFQIVTIILVIISLLFDAPLGSIANPLHTEVPAKAPWYFLGLQELLHYFPPVVAGVLIPALVIISLFVMPYFQINAKAERLWETDQKKTFLVLTLVTLFIVAFFSFFHALAISIPTLFIYCLMILPYFIKSDMKFINWMRHISLTNWIMTWFVLLAFVLTVIGVFFRGPYWRWAWPWIEGIY